MVLLSLLIIPIVKSKAKTITGIAGYALTYTLDTEQHTITLKGEGPLGDYLSPEYSSDCRAFGKMHWKLDEGITRIAGINNNACRYMKSIQLPKTLETIDDTAFRNCINLESITIPENVETIGPTAFRDCISLKRVENHSRQTVYLPTYPMDNAPEYVRYNYYVNGKLTAIVPPGKTAIGKAKLYRVYLNTKGGKLKKNYSFVSYRFAEPLTLPAAKKKGYIFRGWTTEKHSNYSWYHISNSDIENYSETTRQWMGPQNVYAQYTKITMKKTGKRKLKVELSQWLEAEQLEIQYSTNKKYKNPQKITVKEKHLSNIAIYGKRNQKKQYQLNFNMKKSRLSLTLNKLKAKKKYYFRFQFSGNKMLNADEYVYTVGDWFKKSMKM